MSYINQVQEIIDKRISSLDYLRRVHGGKLCYLNTVQLSKQDFEQIYWDENKQHPPLNSLNYFYLGGSLNTLFEHNQHSLSDLLKSFVAMLKEYETLTGIHENTPKNRIAGVGRRLFRGRLKSNTHDHQTITENTLSLSTVKSRQQSSSNSSGNAISPVSSTFSGASSVISTTTTLNGHEFHHLNVFHLPFIPDVYETFVSLCESLIEAYTQIKQIAKTQSVITHDCYELILKIDDKIRKFIISPTIKDIDTLSRSLIYEETTKLDSLLVQAK